MHDFLVEIGCEELPANELATLSNNFSKLLQAEFKEQAIAFADSKVYATPRRLAVILSSVASKQADRNIDRLGPNLKLAYDDKGNPSKAALGFAASCAVEVSQLKTKDGKLHYSATQPGVDTIELIPTIVSTAISKLQAKRSMRWGSGDLRFSRPIHWILLLFGEQVIQTQIHGITSDNLSYGHRVHHPEAITIANTNEYEAKLLQAKVVASIPARTQLIEQQLTTVASENQAEALIDKNLLSEVACLVEYPTTLCANFSNAFLELPPEVLITAMQSHQKCFALADPNNKLIAKFLLVSNVAATDSSLIISGNQKVMQARLQDADFHYRRDLESTLEAKAKHLRDIVFQQQLGTIWDKTQRVAKLSSWLAPQFEAESEDCTLASKLCKADLVSNMVYEFPELQGTMGKYYALAEGINADIAAAIEQHYQPRSAHDELPLLATGATLAVADRIDSLVGMFAIGNVPTGDKDPFALRRQALAVIRILVKRQIKIEFKQVLEYALALYEPTLESNNAALLQFFQERMKAWYLEQNFSANAINSVLATAYDSPWDFHQRLHAIVEFSKEHSLDELIATNKRVQNILKNKQAEQQIDQQLLVDPSEHALYLELQQVQSDIAKFTSGPDYLSVLRLLTKLQSPIADFFANVMVMVEDKRTQDNRIALLSVLHNTLVSVADFAKL